MSSSFLSSVDELVTHQVSSANPQHTHSNMMLREEEGMGELADYSEGTAYSQEDEQILSAEEKKSQ